MKRPKLLVADDSVTVRKVIELTFAEEGIDVFATGDGESAMKRFVEIEPDIVLVDVNMPEPTGYHICEMIKQDESTRHIPVLLLVGSFEPFDQTEAERVQADGFLTKPFQSVRELVGRVTELLGSDNVIPPVQVETADIKNLYESSFAETYRPDGQANNTFLGDAGMDDELIETSRREGAHEPEPSVVGEEIVGQEIVQGYDWMAEPVNEVTEPSAGITYSNGNEHALRGPDLDEADTDVLEARLDELEPRLERVVDDVENKIEVEEPSEGVEPETGAESFVPAKDHSFQSDEQETASDSHVAEPEDEPPLLHHDEITSYEPSEEFINIITRRVIEKLSDKAVREIALEAVPRIAEKLIREALDLENKRRNL